MSELLKSMFELLETMPTKTWIGLVSLILVIFIFIWQFVELRHSTNKKRKRDLAAIKLQEEERLKKAKANNEEIFLEYLISKEKKQKEIGYEIKPKIKKDSYENTKGKVTKINEPHVEYIANSREIDNIEPDVVHKKIHRPENKLPEAKREIHEGSIQNLFVNYESTIDESKESYPIFRCPKKNCIIRSHRFGNTKRRGFKEEAFQSSIKNCFGSEFIISGEVRLNTGKDTRPYEPDIAIIGKAKENNIRVDIEIDEPYAGVTRQPTHCINEDLMRDIYFVDRGWIVIRFSEFQVHTQEMACLYFIAKIINSINGSYTIPKELNFNINLIVEKLWDIVQAQRWEKGNYRENYLNHTFTEIPQKKETIERDFNYQELNEEKLVKSTIIGIVDHGRKVAYNLRNSHIRDIRIKFYPEPHVYLIDNVPAPSASTIIAKFFPEFDAYSAAVRLTPGNPLFGLPVEEIVEIWKKRGQDAANKGTFLHEQIEKYYLGEHFEETEEFHLFKQFVKEHENLNPYRSEWRIFDDYYHIAGTIDLIVRTEDGYEIYDWKRSKNVINTWDGTPIIHDTWRNTGIGQLSQLPNTSYNHYCLQQSLYKFILEKNYKIKISNMYLVVLYPNYTTYYKVETPYLERETKYILDSL